MNTQYIDAASQEEAELTLRIVRAKDEISKLDTEFQKDAEEFRAGLRPHNAAVYERPDQFSQEERDRADEDNRHNIDLARPFASKWELPWEPNLNVDPSYLADRPFSGAPYIGGTRMAVVESGDEYPPVIRLDIDVRFDTATLKQRIGDRIVEAKAQWENAGGPLYRRPGRDCEKLEKMVQVGQLIGQKTQEEIGEELGISPEYVSRLAKELRTFQAERSYAWIAPYTHMAWPTTAGSARLAHWEGAPKEGVPFRSRPVT